MHPSLDDEIRLGVMFGFRASGVGFKASGLGLWV